MKKLFLILSLFASLGLEAQDLFYYLPRTVIKLELTIEETQYHIGPYAEYATELLGTNAYIKENKTILAIKDIDIQLGSEPDYDAAYFIDYDEKSKEPFPNIILEPDGIIKAVGYDNLNSNFLVGRNYVDYNSYELKQTEPVSFIEVLDNQKDDDDDEEEGRSTPKKLTKSDRAKLAIENIDKIRSAYLDLISGINETNYGNTISYMAENLQNIENEYVSLFKGKKIVNTYKKCFYIKPNKNDANASITCGKLDNGDIIKIQFETKNTNSNQHSLSGDVPNTEQPNKVFYRIPALTNVSITSGKETLLNKTLIISQFGDMSLIATKNNKILYNPNTGQIISINH